MVFEYFDFKKADLSMLVILYLAVEKILLNEIRAVVEQVEQFPHLMFAKELLLLKGNQDL